VGGPRISLHYDNPFWEKSKAVRDRERRDKKKQAGAELCQARTQFDLPAEATAEGKSFIFLSISSYLGHFPFNSSYKFSKGPTNIRSSWVIDNICTVRILYRDLSDSPLSGTI
jgi:hypothetical protein